MQSKLFRQLIILLTIILAIIFLTGYVFELLTKMTTDSHQMTLVINILKFAIVFGVGLSILFSTKVFLKHSVENVRKIKESEDHKNKKLESEPK